MSTLSVQIPSQNSSVYAPIWQKLSVHSEEFVDLWTYETVWRDVKWSLLRSGDDMLEVTIRE